MVCPKCGKEIPAGAKFCTGCGAVLKAEKVPEQEKAELTGQKESPDMAAGRPKPKKILWFILAGIAVLAAAAALIVYPRLRYKAVLEKGIELVKQGENWQAIPLLEEAVKLEPKQEVPYAYLAKACFATGPANNAKGWDTLAAGRRETGGFRMTCLDSWQEGLGDMNDPTIWMNFAWQTYLGVNNEGQIEQLIGVGELGGLNMNYRFEYDPQKKLTEEYAYNSRGDLTVSTQFFYNKYGQLERRVRSLTDGGSITTTSYSYSDIRTHAPSTIRRETTFSENNLHQTVDLIVSEIEYDSQGGLKAMKQQLFSGDEKIEVCKKEYNAQGHIVQKEMEYYEPEETRTFVYTYIYDRNGKLIRVENALEEETIAALKRDEKGRVVREEKGTSITEYQFDQMGNLTATVRRSGDDSVFHMEYEYTSQGRVTKLIFRDKDGKAEDGVAYEYDSLGRVVSVRGSGWYADSHSRYEHPEGKGARFIH